MKAVIKVGGKQYFVEKDDEIFVEKLDANPGDTVEFKQVLMLDGKVGTPYLEIVFKTKAKKNYRRKQGHRQPYTKVKITKING